MLNRAECKAVSGTRSQFGALPLNTLKNGIKLVPVMAALLLFAHPAWSQESHRSDVRPSVSLTLAKAIDLAMQNNRRLRMSKLSVEAGRAKQSVARSNYYPHISNQSTALYVTELQGVSIPAGALAHSSATGLIPSKTVTVGQGALDTFTSGTGLVQPITQLFKIRAENKAAAADVRSEELDEAATEHSVSLLVHELYSNLLIQQAHLEAAKSAMKAAQIGETEAAKAVAEGRALDSVALQAHATTLDQEQKVLTEELTIDDVMLQLDDACGLSLGTRVIPDPGSVSEDPDLPTREQAFVISLQQNPKVLAAQEAVKKAKTEVSAARDAYIPDLTGLARYSYQSGVPFLAHNFGTFGGMVSIDLFDGGAREGKLKQAKIGLEIAETEERQDESELQIQVAAGYDQIERLRQLVAVVQEAYKARVEAARISLEQVAHSAQLASSHAKDEAAVYEAQASLDEARFQLFLAQGNIRTMLGQNPR